jgi:hypothetical protein
MTRRVPALAFVMLLLGACAPEARREPATTAEPQAQSKTGLRLRIVPHVDMYYLVRYRAAAPPGVAIEPELGEAVTAARRIQEFFGTFGGWGPVDTLFIGADRLADVRAAAAAVDDPFELRDGRQVDLRTPVLDLVAALERLEPAFLERSWPERRAALDTAMQQLEQRFLPAHRQALAFMLQSLGIADPELEAPVFLVQEANAPGAFTFYLRGGAPACVVRIDEGVNTQLFETVLHEATHVLDMASDEHASVFVTLRELLERRGVGSDDRRIHDVPHTLMFVQAGETVRRFYDPQHVDYGATTTLYARSEPIASIELEIWHEHLAGKLARDEALARIVDRVLAEKP